MNKWWILLGVAAFAVLALTLCNADGAAADTNVSSAVVSQY